MVGKDKERFSITFPKTSMLLLDGVSEQMGKSRSEVLHMCFMYVALDSKDINKGGKE